MATIVKNMYNNDMYKYGWIRDLPDVRDLKFQDNKSFFGEPLVLPQSLNVDLRNHNMPEVYNQAASSSCTANAICGAYEYELKKQGDSDFMPSRLFLYYCERDLEGSSQLDNGAIIRDGFKCLASQGVCPETVWPFNLTAITTKPTDEAYKAATSHKGLQYVALDQNLLHFKHALMSGYPIVFGFSVYSYFESAEMSHTGILKMPQPNEQMLGGHAVVIVGLNDDTKMFLVRNSWGASWGLNGYFWMPYDYALSPDLADDFWCLKLVS